MAVRGSFMELAHLSLVKPFAFSSCRCRTSEKSWRWRLLWLHQLHPTCFGAETRPGISRHTPTPRVARIRGHPPNHQTSTSNMLDMPIAENSHFSSNPAKTMPDGLRGDCLAGDMGEPQNYDKIRIKLGKNRLFAKLWVP